MSVFASATWGISGTGFLIGYVVIALASWAAMFTLRRAILGSPGAAAPTLGALELAMLAGGPRLVATAAGAELYAKKTIESGPGRHTMHASGRRGRKLDEPIERELLEWIGGHDHVAVRRMKEHVRRLPGVHELRRGLVEQGLLMSRARALALPLGVLAAAFPAIAIGLARIVAGTHNHKPTGDLAVALVVVIVAAIWLARPQRRTAAGDHALGARRALSGTRATRSLGPALAVALFGANAVGAIDPVVAAAMSAPRAGHVGAVAGTGVGAGFWGGNGCGGGTSCGGGSCGGGGGGCGG